MKIPICDLKMALLKSQGRDKDNLLNVPSIRMHPWHGTHFKANPKNWPLSMVADASPLEPLFPCSRESGAVVGTAM
jgi:hypothetical protein